MEYQIPDWSSPLTMAGVGTGGRRTPSIVRDWNAVQIVVPEEKEKHEMIVLVVDLEARSTVGNLCLIAIL